MFLQGWVLPNEKKPRLKGERLIEFFRGGIVILVFIFLLRLLAALDAFCGEAENVPAGCELEKVLRCR
jgi:hypothetical protein